MTGIIHSFESMAAVDGEGVRFSVFFAGCPLRCAYCHNPDTWQLSGREMTPEEVAEKIKRFRPYFGHQGGATFSGGEPLLQSRFLEKLAFLLKKEGIRYVVDTSGSVPLSDSVKNVLSQSQEVLLDLKFWDDASYQKYTGHGMELPLATLAFLENIKKPVVVRTVIVPGINDREEQLIPYLSYVKGMSCLNRYELLPFHTMGFFKYEKLGISNPLAQTPALSEEVCCKLQKFADHFLKEDG